MPDPVLQFSSGKRNPYLERSERCCWWTSTYVSAEEFAWLQGGAPNGVFMMNESVTGDTAAAGGNGGAESLTVILSEWVGDECEAETARADFVIQLIFPLTMRRRKIWVEFMPYDIFLSAMLDGWRTTEDSRWQCLKKADMVIGGVDFSMDYR